MFEGGLLTDVVLLTWSMALSQDGEEGPVEETSWPRLPLLSWNILHFSTFVTRRENCRKTVYMHIHDCYSSKVWKRYSKFLVELF